MNLEDAEDAKSVFLRFFAGAGSFLVGNDLRTAAILIGGLWGRIYSQLDPEMRDIVSRVGIVYSQQAALKLEKLPMRHIIDRAVLEKMSLN